MGIIFVELSKLDYKKSVESMSDLEEWAFYLRYSDNPKYRNIIETLKSEKEVFRMAYETQEIISQDLDERAYYMSRLKYELDMDNKLNTKIYQIARNLISLSVPIDVVIKSTGLSEKELNTIQNH
jgi:hypothetical protein